MDKKKVLWIGLGVVALVVVYVLWRSRQGSGNGGSSALAGFAPVQASAADTAAASELSLAKAKILGDTALAQIQASMYSARDAYSLQASQNTASTTQAIAAMRARNDETSSWLNAINPGALLNTLLSGWLNGKIGGGGGGGGGGSATPPTRPVPSYAPSFGGGTMVASSPFGGSNSFGGYSLPGSGLGFGSIGDGYDS